jgi:phospholipid/cholesterol/gamma-HCH transport system permease protein
MAAQTKRKTGVKPPWLVGQGWLHLDHLAVSSLPLIVVTLSLAGVAFAREGAIQAQMIIGTVEVLGPEYMRLTVTEMGPVITALMLTMRVGSGIAAEIANLTVSQATTAYQVFGGRAQRDLVIPRIWAGVVGCVLLVPIGVASFLLSGTLAVALWFDVPQEEFLFFRHLDGLDLMCAMVKAVLFGAVIPFIAARAGLAARGGSGAVGQASAKAVVHGTVAVLFIDLLVAAVVAMLRDGRLG